MRNLLLNLARILGAIYVLLSIYAIVVYNYATTTTLACLLVSVAIILLATIELWRDRK